MIYIHNRKIGKDYTIEEKLVAGIELFGFEVKSIKQSQGSLEGAFVSVDKGEAYIVSMFVPPYQEKNTPSDYDPTRKRKLLLTTEEIRHLAQTLETNGLTVVPISVYNIGSLIKVELGVAKGKKKFDKRESIKKRETLRTIDREYKAR